MHSQKWGIGPPVWTLLKELAPISPILSLGGARRIREATGVVSPPTLWHAKSSVEKSP